LLDEVSAKAKSYKSIKVDFSYTMVNIKAKINEEKSGTLLVSGDRYKMTAAVRPLSAMAKQSDLYIRVQRSPGKCP